MIIKIIGLDDFITQIHFQIRYQYTVEICLCYAFVILSSILIKVNMNYISILEGYITLLSNKNVS